MPDSRFRIKAESENETKTLVKARKFHLVVDEPPELGGKDEGANPVEYVLTALAGCLNVMGHLIAKEMGIRMNGLRIDIMGDLNADKLFGKPTEDRAGYKNIEAKITPDCDADSESLEKWIKEVEARCPVSDNLINPTPVKIALK